MKKCSRCGEEKPESEFHKNSQQKSGLACACKVCENARGRNRPDEQKAQRRAYSKIYGKVHREKSNNKLRRWRDNNRDHVNAEARRRLKDPIEHVCSKMRHQLRQNLVLDSSRETNKTMSIVGLSRSEYKKYLIETYEARYGEPLNTFVGVQIDHIKPLNMASSVEEVYLMCYYTNLQLLKTQDNLKKGTNHEEK
jgi:hypothetical protein